jgi:glycogen debranching enzyme
MYDPATEAFYDVYGKDNKQLKVLTFTIALPVILKEVSQETARRILQRHFLNADEFDLPYPIPSVAKCEPSFNPGASRYLWRGPTWPVINWFLYHSFIANGFEEHASRLKSAMKALIDKSGFREFYNPYTGDGYGAENFTWAGLITDMNQH